MAINTKNVSSNASLNNLSKRELVYNLQSYHHSLFEKEGVSNPKFIPRLCYKHNGEDTVSFYNRELYGGVDIYIEFCNREYIPEDPNRTLWKWIYNPEYAIEYEKSDPHAALSDVRYLIPVAELINVTKLHSAPVPESITSTEPEPEELFVLPKEVGDGTDIPYEAMTLRDYAAIQWKKPVSYKPWLNELITKTFKK